MGALGWPDSRDRRGFRFGQQAIPPEEFALAGRAVPEMGHRGDAAPLVEQALLSSPEDTTGGTGAQLVLYRVSPYIADTAYQRTRGHTRPAGWWQLKRVQGPDKIE